MALLPQHFPELPGCRMLKAHNTQVLPRSLSPRLTSVCLSLFLSTSEPRHPGNLRGIPTPWNINVCDARDNEVGHMCVSQLRGEEHLHDDQLNVDEQCCQDRNIYSSSCGHGVTRSYVSVIYAPRERRLGLPTRLGL